MDEREARTRTSGSRSRSVMVQAESGDVVLIEVNPINDIEVERSLVLQ